MTLFCTFVFLENVVCINNYSTTNDKSKLNVIWCGINENQDNSGLIQGLMNNFNTLIYYRSKNKYGLKNNTSFEFTVKIRIDTAMEWNYFTNDGILNYVLKNIVNS